MIFRRSLSIYLLLLSGSATASNLRSAADNSNLEVSLQVKLFKEWSESHGKEYSSEEAMMARMKVWLENDSKYRSCFALEKC